MSKVDLCSECLEDVEGSPPKVEVLLVKVMRLLYEADGGRCVFVTSFLFETVYQPHPHFSQGLQIDSCICRYMNRTTESSLCALSESLPQLITVFGKGKAGTSQP